ncbi:murein transglycosylase [Vibrio sp. SM6]|uniref:Murein transglycosylase n=1 Tax=Vibrio agarilyticus TaxID=2726741 RepID=A0A7X8TQ79_9VIBR|nr:murein transglycosylase [Vibrio agarilyticus]NLS12223.1 murein transglycosylase [Vibrio agarilyticus]
MLFGFVAGLQRQLRNALMYGCVIMCAFPSMAWAAQDHRSQNELTQENLKQSREWYRQAQLALKTNQQKKYQALRNKLTDYPLVPYLDYRVFKQNLSKHSVKEVQQFVGTHQSLPFSTRIAAPYLDLLFKRQAWRDIVEFHPTTPKSERYRCIYYTALAKTDQADEASHGARNLWLNGQSVDDACDGLFRWWADSGGRTDALIIERMQLAFAARNRSLVRYLSRMPQSLVAKQQAKALVDLQRNPKSVTHFAKQQMATQYTQQQSAIALKLWARQDVAKAQAQLDKVAQALKWPKALYQEVSTFMAWRLFQTESQPLAIWRDDVIVNSQNDALIERRLRLAIQQGDWSALPLWAERLSPKLRHSQRWQFWLARSDIFRGFTEEGHARLKTLLGQRNFYSVAAAQYLSVPYRYPVQRQQLDPTQIEPHDSALMRIEELVALGKLSAAKSEWIHTLRLASDSEKPHLAVYAAKMGWPHLSVKASIKAKMWNDLTVRFPLAYQKRFDFYAKKHQIDLVTLLSLARQESALDGQARSPVGARGLMQIMPKTAAYTARKYQIAYHDSDQLYNVGKNIEIGSQYLKGLLDQYDNNRIFALAAYNAGPHRVKTWRARTKGSVDVYAFIEAIPFKETRGYVQNILMFETYYRYLLDLQGDFITPNELNHRY